jgi:hypothetical protein
MIKLSKLKTNPQNPRQISDEDFEKLKSNIDQYPKLLELRPIIIESFQNPVILGGNMRYKALKDLGYKEIPQEWVKEAKDLTEEEKKAFIALDNVSFGIWDFEALKQQYSPESLEGFNIEVINFEAPELEEFFEKTKKAKKEDSQGFKIILEYTEEDYYEVLEAFKKHTGTKKSIIYKLLGCND